MTTNAKTRAASPTRTSTRTPSPSRRGSVWPLYLAVAAAMIFALFPIIFVVSAALNPSGSLSTTTFIPKNAGLSNFSQLLSLRPYWSWYKNSMIIAGVGAFASVFIGACAAYAFSRMRFVGRRPGLLFLLLIQMFPAPLAFVALFITFLTVGDIVPAIGLNTSAGLILAYLGGAMGANVWLLKGYFDTVPRELDEAAKVDGASHARIFFTMQLRLVTPILVTVGTLSFVGLFNEFLLASVFLKDVDQQTLGVGLWALLTADKNLYFGAFCAGAVLASAPIVLVYLAFQKQLIGGLTTGSVK